MNYLTATKYPKTQHFDFSLSISDDDRIIESLWGFEKRRVIVTSKMDGENSNIYKDYFHPRSVIDDGHPSRSWLKGYIAKFQYQIPDGWRICGENLYAQHSIVYDDLKTYFYVFNIWDENNVCLSYDDTISFCKKLDIVHVPVVYDGIFNYNEIKKIFLNFDFNKTEGIVCRLADSFPYEKFDLYCAKAVRKNHVNTDEHWSKTWKPNKLIK